LITLTGILWIIADGNINAKKNTSDINGVHLNDNGWPVQIVDNNGTKYGDNEVKKWHANKRLTWEKEFGYTLA